MLVALFLLGFAGVFFCFLERQGRVEGGAPIRESLMAAALLVCGLSVVFSEVLGRLGALKTWPLAGAWLLAGGWAWGFVIRSGITWKKRLRAFGRPHTTGVDTVMVLAIGAVLAILFGLSYVASMLAVDTLTYHLPRVVHWIQNASLEHYPTTDARQLYHPPFMELVEVHVRLLGGGRGATAAARVFWVLGCSIAASLITREMGGNPRAQLSTAAIVTALPMLILQTPGGKNDSVAAFFLCCLAFYALRARTAERGQGLWAALALGLAMLTKLTAYFVGFPIAVAYVIQTVRTRGFAWRDLACFACLPLLLSAGHYARNLDVYGHPLAPQDRRQGLGMQEFGPALIASNALRGASIHLGTPVPEINAAIYKAVVALHGPLGLDVSDPRTTYAGALFRIPPPVRDVSRAGNPFHVLALGGALVWLLVRRGGRRDRRVLQYMWMLLGSTLFFCSLIQWQPGISRLQLPLFVLACPLIGIAWAGPRLSAAIGLGLLALSWSPLTQNGHLPLRTIHWASRYDLLFLSHPELGESMGKLVPYIAEQGHDEIGLFPLSNVHLEYPVWEALEGETNMTRFQYIELRRSPEELLAREPFASFRPDAILVVPEMRNQGREEGWIPHPETIEYAGLIYSRSLSLPRLSLYEP